MRRNVLAALGCVIGLGAAQGVAADWAQWRGPRRDGHVQGFRVPAPWPGSLTKQWSIPVGEGHGSPIIAGNRAYLLVREGEQEQTLCLDLATGKVVWKDTLPAPFDSVIFPARRLGKSPRSTPLFHEGKLYTVGINGVLSCYAAGTGKVLWRKDFASAFRVPMPVCGASLSPLVDGKRLYVHAGHDNEGAFFALDKDTGQELWKWSGDGPAYTSPVAATIAGVPQVVTASHDQWIGLNAATGALLWSMRVRQNFFNHQSVTPVVQGDLVFCGANQRNTMALRIRKGETGWTADKVWETREVTLSTSSPVLAGNVLYAVSEKRRGQLVCLAPATGKTTWSCPGDQGEHVTLYDAGTHLLTFGINGDLKAYRKERDSLAEVARYELSDSATWASPAISGNQILVKGARSLTLWRVPTP